MANNISILASHCYSCSVCSNICPKQIIHMELNKDGFYQPVLLNDNDCLQCGLCLEVCSFCNDLEKDNTGCAIQGFATWSKDETIRKTASSGGTGYEISRYLLNKGYKIIAARYNAKHQLVEHYIADSENALAASIGSKYIQSNPEVAFGSIKKGEKYLITGTPCQIASMRRYVKQKRMEEDVVLMDFFCHGVPSKLVWDKYIAEIEAKIGKVISASWRNKQTGWHDSWAIELDLEKLSGNVSSSGYNNVKYSCRRSEGDMFYKFFLSNVCLNQACYRNCKFKYLDSAADIRIGDLWGAKYANDEKGVTGVLTLTERGRKILNECDIEKISEPVDVVTEGQLKEGLSKPYFYSLFFKLLRSKMTLNQIYRIVQVLRIGRIIRYKLS